MTWEKKVHISVLSGRHLGIAIATVLVLGACAAEDDPARPAQTDAEDAMLAFAECLRDNGADVDDPSTDGMLVIDGSIDPQSLATAQKACSDLMPDQGVGPGRGETVPDVELWLELTACMRDRGIDVPDPTTGADGHLTQPLDAGFDPGAPEVVEARAACAEELGLTLPGATP
ncbi:hypothetical protein GCM10023339_76200 [Alloalcanivorax gelatiniphagus]